SAMSDEPIKLAEGMTAARQSGRIENHVCEFDVCGKRAPFGFAKPTTITLVCFEHREHGDSYLAGGEMISRPREANDYPDRVIDCQEAMEPGFQAIVDCMLRSLKRLIAADNMTQKGNARTETQLAIARAMMRAGRPF
ncbi:hypothetical protein MJ877_35295, partial [Mesorhizobium jarvisii]